MQCNTMLLVLLLNFVLHRMEFSMKAVDLSVFRKAQVFQSMLDADWSLRNSLSNRICSAGKKFFVKRCDRSESTFEVQERANVFLR